MFRLLNIEIHKLKNSRASKFLIITYFVLLTSIALIAAIKFDIGPIQFHLAENGIFNFPYIWHFNTYIASFFKFFLLLVIVSMMANEYSNRTLKQNLIDGLSKKEFILSKFYTVILFAVISTAFVFIISLILGYTYSDYDELSIVFSDLSFLLAYFVKLLGFFSFGLFMGILVKRSAFAIGGMLIWLFVESISKLFFFWKFNENPRVSPHTDAITQFYPFESMSNLIGQPATRLQNIQEAAKQFNEKFSADYYVHWYEIVIVLAWTFLFIYASYRLLQKRDL